MGHGQVPFIAEWSQVQSRCAAVWGAMRMGILRNLGSMDSVVGTARCAVRALIWRVEWPFADAAARRPYQGIPASSVLIPNVPSEQLVSYRERGFRFCIAAALLLRWTPCSNLNSIRGG